MSKFIISDPEIIRTGYAGFREAYFAGAKYYRAKWIANGSVIFSRKRFKRTSEAEDYSRRVINRYRVLKALANKERIEK